MTDSRRRGSAAGVWELWIFVAVWSAALTVVRAEDDAADRRKAAGAAVAAYEAAVAKMPLSGGRHRVNARKLIAELVADPTRETLDDWRLWARVELATDRRQSAYSAALAFVAVERLKPDWASDAALKESMDKLSARGKDALEEVRRMRSTFLAAHETIAAGKPDFAALSEAYESGMGVPVNTEQAMRWQRAGAEAGDWKSMLRLAESFASGEPRDAKAALQAFQWTAKAAEKGDHTAYLALARLYQHGDGVAANPALARQWFEKAAATGDVRSMHELASHYAEMGNLPKTVEWMKKVIDAELKDEKRRLSAAYHMSELARFYLRVDEDKPDTKAAVEWFEKAAALGDHDASWQLAMLYSRGEGVPRDEAATEKWLAAYAKGREKDKPIDGSSAQRIGRAYADDYDEQLKQDQVKSRQWLEKAAEAGDLGGMVELAFMLEAGIGGPKDAAKAAQWLEKAGAIEYGAELIADELMEKDDDDDGRYAKALPWKQRAAEKGSSGAMRWLGFYYAAGRGGAKDPAKASEWFEKAVKAESNQGHYVEFDIARRFAEGDAGEPDEKAAAAWYRRAAEGGLGHAMVELAARLDSGTGVERDAAQAARWIENAIESADHDRDVADMLLRIGERYAEGDVFAKSDANAVALFRRAAEAGSDRAMMLLGLRLDSGIGVARDEAESTRWLLKAIEKDPENLSEIAEAYSSGEGVPKNPAKAQQWYEKAAELGGPDEMYALAHQYLKGDHDSGMARDQPVAFKWFVKAADAGHVEAMRQVGWMLCRGTGTPRDDAKALEWFRKGEAAGDVNASILIGIFHEDGRVVKRDIHAAMAIYRAAAEKGNTSGMVNLGRCLLFGHGGKRETEEARKWFQKAMDEGDNSARGYLNIIPQ